ncbi:hypothetical protein AAAC51_07855 [Priestia megaterium]
MDLTLDPRLIDDKVEELPFEFESYEDEVAFKSELREWHEEYGSIYTVEINEINFFFRHLTKKKWQLGKKSIPMILNGQSIFAKRALFLQKLRTIH